MLYVVLFLIVLDFLYFKLKYSSRKGPPAWYLFPFVGALPVLILPKSVFVILYNWYIKNAPDAVIVRMPIPMLLAKGAFAKAMYVNESCQGKPELKAMSFLGWMMTGEYGLVYTDGNKMDWKGHRKIDLATMYALPKREMILRSSEVVDLFLEEIEKHENEIWDCEQELAVSKYQESANLNLGSTFKDNEIKNFVDFVQSVFKRAVIFYSVVTLCSVTVIKWFEVLLPKLLRPTEVSRVYQRSLRSLIEKRLSEGKDVVTRDYLQAALRVNEPEQAYKYLCASSLFLMAANTHSTHHTLLTALTYLSVRPECQEKLYDELRTVVGYEQLTLDHLDVMHYLKAVIMEVNRLDTPFPFNLRLSTAPTTVLDYEIPAHMQMIVLTHGQNFDEKAFPKPYTFRPENFLDEIGNYRKNPNLGSFGAGKRECPGKHINLTTSSVYLAKILQHYEVVAVDKNAVVGGYDGAVFPGPAKVPFRFVRRDPSIELPKTRPRTDLSLIFKGILDGF